MPREGTFFSTGNSLNCTDTVVDRIVVGGSFADSVRAGVERGHYLDAIGREEEWLAERLDHNRQDSYSTEQHLRGDRWVRIDERRTADGGSIGVRIDITDSKRREEDPEKAVGATRRSPTPGEDRRLSYSSAIATVVVAAALQLLAYDPTQFTPTRDAVLSGGVRRDRAARRIPGGCHALRKSKSVDVKVNRGDGNHGRRRGHEQSDDR
jgi:hypothetical protein